MAVAVWVWGAHLKVQKWKWNY